MRRTASNSRSDEPDEERWLCGDELRVSGEVMEEEVRMEEGEAERMETPRVGLKAVLRRRREPVVLRRGVKDWKRLVRDGEEGILALLLLVE